MGVILMPNKGTVNNPKGNIATLRPGKLANPNHSSNLVPFTTETARLAQKKAMENRKRTKDMQKTVKTLLNLSLHSGDMLEADDVMSLAELKGQNISVADAIAIAQVQKALKGDTSSASLVISWAGEKPAEKVDVGFSFEDYVKNHKVKL